MGAMRFNFSFITRYYLFYIEGLKMTLKLAFFALIFATICGVVVGLMRLSKNKPVFLISTAYVNFIRGVPLLIQIYIIYYGMPWNLPEFWAGVAALTINAAAYMG